MRLNLINNTAVHREQSSLNFFIFSKDKLLFVKICLALLLQKLNINLVKTFLTSISFDSLSRKIKNPCLVINKNLFLTKAIEDGQLEIVKYLVENGVDINAKDKDGKTTLMKTVENRNLEIVKYLVDNGANVNAKNKNGNTPLILAPYGGDKKNIIGSGR